MRRLMLPILAGVAIVGVLTLASSQARTIVHTAQLVGGLARTIAPPWMQSNPSRSYPRSNRGACMVAIAIPLARPGESSAVPIPPARPNAVQVVPIPLACAPAAARIAPLPRNSVSTMLSQ